MRSILAGLAVQEHQCHECCYKHQENDDDSDAGVAFWGFNDVNSRGAVDSRTVIVVGEIIVV